MKAGIVIVIVLGMLGWAMFDFVNTNDTSEEENTMSRDYITSSSPEESEEVVESGKVGLERGDIAPDFELTTLDGETVLLSDYRGKRVMLNFWATWCPPCRAEMPDMQKLYEEEDIAILAVNMTESESNEEVVADFVDDFELTFPILMDQQSDVMEMYQIQAYPTSYMIDSSGEIQFIALGAMNHDQMLQQLEMMD
ncbi:peroxiredoxin family protein [Virgibacillus kimchii]